MTKVFIDGSAGTTGLRIEERLSNRTDIALIKIEEAYRKDVAARKDAINRADIAFLCLPDAAAIEAVSLVENESTAVIDTSTAHRVADGWIYGMPELVGQREKIAKANRIANPGCHASGFIALVEPLISAGILPPSTPLSAFSLTGYSGGGKKMIAEYEAEGRNELLGAPRQYGLSQSHKHLPEMVKICGLDTAPVFCPIVGDFYAGMEVTVALHGVDKKQVEEVYLTRYATGLIRYCREADESGFLSAAAYAGRDTMEISVQGNEQRLLLVARFDNLGKGASGAAIQNMNIRMGVEESKGLEI